MKYLVITGKGYWGKASTVEGACANAKVPAKGVQGVIYKIPADFVERFDCSEMGGVSLRWSKEVFDKQWNLPENAVPENIQKLLDGLWSCSCVASGLIKYSKQQNKVTAEIH